MKNIVRATLLILLVGLSGCSTIDGFKEGFRQLGCAMDPNRDTPGHDNGCDYSQPEKITVVVVEKSTFLNNPTR